MFICNKNVSDWILACASKKVKNAVSVSSSCLCPITLPWQLPAARVKIAAVINDLRHIKDIR